MTLHADLLEQARHLASREPRKPRQASLRRAVSAAYYALFHFLTDEATLRLVPTRPAGLRQQVRRAFQHADIRMACQLFSSGSVMDDRNPNNLLHLLVNLLEQEIRFIAATFVSLQRARHLADYDHVTLLVRAEALLKIDQAERAFAAWKAVRLEPNARVFLTALVFQRHLKR